MRANRQMGSCLIEHLMLLCSATFFMILSITAFGDCIKGRMEMASAQLLEAGGGSESSNDDGIGPGR